MGCAFGWMCSAGCHSVVSLAPLYWLVMGALMLLLRQRRETFLTGQRANVPLPAILDDGIGGAWRGGGVGEGCYLDIWPSRPYPCLSLFSVDPSSSWRVEIVLPLDCSLFRFSLAWLPGLQIPLRRLTGPVSPPSWLLFSQGLPVPSNPRWAATDGGDLLVASVFVFPSPAVGSAKRPA